jgi:hypothetical protein
MIPPVYVHCGIGLLLILLSIPLVLRKIPMNRAYGVRIPKAFTSDEHWYEINAYGGRLLVAFGLFLVLFGVLARDAAPPRTSPWLAVFTVGPLLLLVPLLALINAFGRRLR